LISDARIEALQQRIADKQEPNYTAYIAMKERADQSLGRKPNPPEHWYIPGYYRDAEGHRTAKEVLKNDANDAYRLALCYRITQEERYAQSAAKLIDGWAAGVKSFSKKDDSTLSFSYHFPPMIFAADLISQSPSWPKQSQKAFQQFVREKALPMNTMSRSNNWGNWGLVLVMGAAVYLDDEALFQKGVTRWKDFIAEQIAPDGHLHHEVNRNQGRSGIWYSNFSLLPQTIAGEIARVNGVFLYDYKAPNGRTLQSAFERLAPWVLHPETFPYWEGPAERLSGVDYISYFEILNEVWPHPAAQKALEKWRPLSARHGAPALTFTHGGLLTLP
jgi:hypothetical protein